MSSDYERYHDAHDGWHRTSACVGTLAMDGVPKQWQVIRNTGGGTSDCCSVYPHAAGARVADDRAIELQLLPRSNRFVQKNRNGARVYLAEQCPAPRRAAASPGGGGAGGGRAFVAGCVELDGRAFCVF